MRAYLAAHYMATVTLISHLTKRAYEVEDHKVSLQDQLDAALACSKELEEKLDMLHLLSDEEVARARREVQKELERTYGPNWRG